MGMGKLSCGVYRSFETLVKFLNALKNVTKQSLGRPKNVNYRPNQQMSNQCSRDLILALTWTLRRASKVAPPLLYMVWRGDGTPPLAFCYVSVFRRDFTFGRKPLMCSTRFRYILCVAVLLAAWKNWKPNGVVDVRLSMRLKGQNDVLDYII